MMNAKEFLTAVDNIVKEKGIDKEIVFEAMETALTTAFKKNYGKSNSKVVINRETGDIKVYSYLTVISDDLELTDEEGNTYTKEVNPDLEITLTDAKKINKTLEVGDTIDTEIKPKEDFSRVATSTAKQVVVQKIREAERNSILNELGDKQDEMLIGTVELEDTDNYYINLGRKGSEKNETYYDAFSNNGVIYQSGAEGFTNVEYETMPLTEFILYYDGIIKEEYTSEELVDLYAKIISDFEIDVSNKKLVLNK